MWFRTFPKEDPLEGVALTDNGFATEKGRGYEFDEDLVAAIDVAMALRRPLLVAGEPGCGKTELGYAIARRLGIQRLYFYSAKSTSETRDLFYVYDAIGRFREAQIKRNAEEADKVDPGDFIEFQALGRAILDAHPRDKVEHLLRGRSRYVHPGAPTRSLVIVDEIDKAPRDFPNDLLREIEELSFRVPEFIQGAKAPECGPTADKDPQTPSGDTIAPDARPIIVVTSNEEAQLPDAFLRRCVFHYIAFPDPVEKPGLLHRIIVNGLKRRAGPALDLGEEDRKHLIAKLVALRGMALQKKPGVSEIIDAAALAATVAGEPAAPIAERAARTAAALVKVKEDRIAFDQVFGVTGKP